MGMGGMGGGRPLWPVRSLGGWAGASRLCTGERSFVPGVHVRGRQRSL